MIISGNSSIIDYSGMKGAASCISPKLNDNNSSISVIYRKMTIWQNHYCIPLGLTAAQVPVILWTCVLGKASQNTLAKKLVIDKSVVAKTVANLIQTGFLQREINPEDTRSYLISPTEKALAVYPFLIENGCDWMNHLTDGMTEEEKSQFSALLKKAAKNAEITVEKLSQ